ncbi:amino acid permease [Limosilactobacillus vaginalis]|jgi:APA family basic amino acid/polyamine antiporter|uniref:Amino acid permease n=2 Tax=Limosilactobacillus vaginalis TaxID=1633 RepID=A0AAP3GFJ7_9LACO|nr:MULTISPECIES: amino acid permease [Limosilactobacillus]PEH05338.1 amino acid permease [Lactobacillus sp. UMNPBX5]EEJ40301.1 amino acid permease [Limosilactobacillus vaginalis DSM 5837 = ATCC 49540]KRM45454.1 APC family amino acid-polyamine-organocation transporter [Limosilactobacillus vaginalis DSM 5837 = ATCC 49540]MCI6853591.1 amino acid permease [Limosilactobacillus vaginalis]MCZ2466321.1 amino acid permease [Limosilactobacillus vaginalis]
MGLNIFRKESLDRYLGADKLFVKTMNARDLMAIGIGTVIGTGIFILPGTIAAKQAGPGVSLSFLLSAIVCAFAAMCYAEFASALPVAGSAYSYGNVVFGEFFGWLLGWALVLEYMLAVASVSTGWAAYFNSFIESFGLKIPHALSGPFDPAHGTYINIVAVVIVLLITVMLSRGLQSSVRVNNIAVVIKVAIILIFIVAGLFFIKPKNYHPFLPYHMSGVIHGATIGFFAYLGFDCVSSSAAEVKNPKRNMPLGIIGTLGIVTLLYMGVAIVLTGMVKYTRLDVANPVSYALQLVHQNWLAELLSIGALIGMFTMMVAMIYSSSRLIYAIGRDGLLPAFLGKLDKKSHSPQVALWIVAVIIATMGGLVSLDQLTSLVNIGTLFAFTLVSFGIIPLRRRKDIGNRGGFKVPLYPFIPILSGLLCLAMMTQLQLETYIGAGIWFTLGIIIYFTYGYWHSKLNDKQN